MNVVRDADDADHPNNRLPPASPSRLPPPQPPLLQTPQSPSPAPQDKSWPHSEHQLEGQGPRHIDRGWAWVVMVSSFMVSAAADGTGYSVGIFLSSLQKEFGANNQQVSWLSSVLNGISLLIGPVVSFFISHHGCRKVALLGCVLTSLSFALTPLCPSIELVIFVFAFLGGLGMGFLYQPSVVIVSHYFCTRRALALGFTACGSGVGVLAFAPLFSVFVDRYSWKGAALLAAGLIFLCAFACATFKDVDDSLTKACTSTTATTATTTTAAAAAAAATTTTTTSTTVSGKLSSLLPIYLVSYETEITPMTEICAAVAEGSPVLNGNEEGGDGNQPSSLPSLLESHKGQTAPEMCLVSLPDAEGQRGVASSTCKSSLGGSLKPNAAPGKQLSPFPVLLESCENETTPKTVIGLCAVAEASGIEGQGQKQCWDAEEDEGEDDKEAALENVVADAVLSKSSFDNREDFEEREEEERVAGGGGETGILEGKVLSELNVLFIESFCGGERCFIGMGGGGGGRQVLSEYCCESSSGQRNVLSSAARLKEQEQMEGTNEHGLILAENSPEKFIDVDSWEEDDLKCNHTTTITTTATKNDNSPQSLSRHGSNTLSGGYYDPGSSSTTETATWGTRTDNSHTLDTSFNNKFIQKLQKKNSNQRTTTSEDSFPLDAFKTKTGKAGENNISASHPLEECPDDTFYDIIAGKSGRKGKDNTSQISARSGLPEEEQEVSAIATTTTTSIAASVSKLDMSDLTVSMTDAEPSCGRRCRELAWSPLRANIYLMQRPSAVLYGLASFLASMASYVPTTFLPLVAEQNQLSSSQGAFLISVLGMGNVLGRLITGLVVHYRPRMVLPLNHLSLLLAGLLTCLLSLTSQYSLMVGYSLLFGACVGMFVVLQLLVLIELLGFDHLNNAFGVINMYYGIGVFVGPPLAGFMADVTGDLSSAFYAVGAAFILAGVMCLGLRHTASVERHHVLDSPCHTDLLTRGIVCNHLHRKRKRQTCLVGGGGGGG